MPSYFQWLKKKHDAQAEQLAGSALLQFLFLLLHALQASQQHSNANTQSSGVEHVPLCSLSNNAIGNLTVADAQWCAPEVILRRIGGHLVKSAVMQGDGMGCCQLMHLHVPCTRPLHVEQGLS